MSEQTPAQSGGADFRWMVAAAAVWTVVTVAFVIAVTVSYDSRLSRIEERVDRLHEMLAATPSNAVPLPAPGRAERRTLFADPYPTDDPVMEDRTAHPVSETEKKSEFVVKKAERESAHSGKKTTGTALPAAPAATEAIVASAPERSEPVGRVLVVQPRQMLAMLDADADDGLSEGRHLTIWRGSDCVGEVEVRKIFADMSACAIVAEFGGGIRVDDTARPAEPEQTPTMAGRFDAGAAFECSDGQGEE